MLICLGISGSKDANRQGGVPVPVSDMTDQARYKFIRRTAFNYCGQLRSAGPTCSNIDCGWDLSAVKSRLAGLRFHDLRHHAITELAESQARDSTIIAIAGHVSPKMLAHYSHIRIETKRQAKSLQVFDKFGGDDETLTRDLCRDRQCFDVIA